MELENELLESDIETIGDFVSYDETHIELDDAVYQIMPVNDLYVSPEEYIQIIGEEYDYVSLSYEDEYLINYKKLTYVEDNMSLMNYMVENEFGFIDENGEIQFYEDEFVQQSLIMNFKLGWLKMTFTTNYCGSILFGALGLLINSDLVKNAKDFLNTREDVVKNCFTDVATNLIYEGCDYYGNLVISSMSKAVSTTMSIKEIVSQATFVGRLIKIVKYILGHYAPGMIRGTIMILDGVFLQYGTDVEIGLWWSNYNILRSKVY